MRRAGHTLVTDLPGGNTEKMETVTAAENKWIARAEELARAVLARHAEDVDCRARWPSEGLAALGESGLLGLTVPTTCGGAGEGARTFLAVTRTLAEQCASTAMIY